MFTFSSRLSLQLGAMLALLLTYAGSGRADTLGLSDGRYLTGEVIEQSPAYVVFRHEINGIWTELKYSRRQVTLLEIVEGDQSDRGRLLDDPSRQAGGTSAESSNTHLPKVFVIPLHGTVGGLGEKSIAASFDATILNHCFDEAQKAGAKAVILDIHSPGGLVSEMEEICQAIINRHAHLRVIAYPNDAFSAAAIISLCCKEMVVRPESRIGAAVIIETQSSGGMSAVDAKMASPHHARQRQFMAASGRPYAVVAAMTIQETQLWWSPTLGFRTEQVAPSEAGWEEIDGRSTVLTMTAHEALRWKLASGQARSHDGVLNQVGMTEPVHIVNLQPAVAQYNKALDRKFTDLVKHINGYFSSLVKTVELLNELREAYQKQDRTAAGRLKGDIGQQITRMNVASRAIQKADKSLLGRRVEVPDEALAQMQTDAQLLNGLNRLLRTDTYEGYNESVDRMKAVLQSWRKLLGNE